MDRHHDHGEEYEANDDSNLHGRPRGNRWAANIGAWADHDQGIKKNVVGAASFFDHLVAERDA